MKAHFAKAGYITAQITSQLKRSFWRLLECQQHQALLSQLIYLGIYEISWKCCCYHFKNQEKLFYHLFPAGKASCLPIFQSTQVHAHPANVIFSGFNITLCLWTAQLCISLKLICISSQYLRGKWFGGRGNQIANTICSCIDKKILAHCFLGRVQKTGKQRMVAVFHWKYWEQSGGPQLWCHAIGKKEKSILKSQLSLSRVIRQEWRGSGNQDKT